MINVLFIMGFGRSGSTALERSLASCDQTITVGEARAVWGRGFDERLCTCGSPLTTCPFWTDVRVRAFGGLDGLDSANAAALMSVRRYRSVPIMHHRHLQTAHFRSNLATAKALIEQLYSAISLAAPGRVIVDSSKLPSYAHLLSLVPGLRVAYIHLVRDSRAVAHSWTRFRQRPDITWAAELMPRQTPLWAAFWWDVEFALALALVPYVRPAVLRVRYEDFAADPGRTIRAIQQHASNVGLPPLGRRRDDRDFTWYHSLQGNPMRFDKHFHVRRDDEWREAMPAGRKALVGAVTAPFLLLHRLGIGFE